MRTESTERNINFPMLISLCLVFAVALSVSFTGTVAFAKSFQGWARTPQLNPPLRLTPGQSSVNVNVSLGLTCREDFLERNVLSTANSAEVGYGLRGRWMRPGQGSNPSALTDAQILARFSPVMITCGQSRTLGQEIPVPPKPARFERGDYLDVTVCASKPASSGIDVTPCEHAIRIDPPGLPDLALSLLRNQADASICGVRLDSLVRNIGEAGAPPSAMSYYMLNVAENGAGYPLTRTALYEIAPGQSKNATETLRFGVTDEKFRFSNCRTEGQQWVCDPLSLELCADIGSPRENPEWSTDNNCVRTTLSAPPWYPGHGACPKSLSMLPQEGLKAPPGRVTSTAAGKLPALPPRIIVTAPGAVDPWCIGQSKQIRWTRIGNMSPTVRIVLRQEQTMVREITPAAPNTGSYPWTVPNDLLPGWYVVRIRTPERPAAVRGDSERFQLIRCP